MEYDEEDYLQLSGIQHYAFCRRQWALIHIENQWRENLRTTEGKLMHENAHDASFTELRGNTLTVRDMRIFSRNLGISGACDIVEFIKDDGGIAISGRPGKYRVRPVEYKHGSPKENNMDELQLAAQAICLEEMLCCEIAEGMLFYGETRRRSLVPISSELKEQVRIYFKEMHEVYRRGVTPKVKTSKSCNACSMKDICLPKLMKRKSATIYISEHIMEEQQ